MRHGPSHPLAVVALLVLVVNDHLWKGVGPGWLTGKLSDGAWLVLMPVVVASLLLRLRMPERVAGGVALGGTGVVFVLLQLWPAFGDTLAGWLHGRNVADPTDLMMLPALALVPLCWRPATPRRWALPVAFLACLASSFEEYFFEDRMPCDTERAWDPNVPLMVDWNDYVPELRSANVRNAITLRRQGSSAEVDLIWAVDDWGVLLLCPRGGLEPDTDYVWDLDPADEVSNHERVDNHVLSGWVRFHTAATTVFPPITTRDACASFGGFDQFPHLECFVERASSTTSTVDTADTGAY